jgi:urease accessory protein UreF
MTMMVGIKTAPPSPAELLGDAHPLLDQLGTSDDLAVTSTVTGAMEFSRVRDLPTLRAFLDNYHAQVLRPVELPAIVSACQHAARGEARELIALDQKLAQETIIRDFAAASCRVGQRQLSKLRPMRDQRVVQRYLAAIETGDARGWHTLVYGVSLAMFSLPLRQGLQNYIEQTARGFIERAARPLRLSETHAAELAAHYFVTAPQAVAHALEASSALQIN